MTSDYKDHSLKLLKEMVDDSIQHTDATPKEIRDSIVNTVRDQIEYHLKCVDRASEFLALLKHHDKTMPKDDRNAVTQKDWDDFWSPSRDRELNEVNKIIKKEGYEYTPPTSHNRVTRLPTRY